MNSRTIRSAARAATALVLLTVHAAKAQSVTPHPPVATPTAAPDAPTPAPTAAPGSPTPAPAAAPHATTTEVTTPAHNATSAAFVDSLPPTPPAPAAPLAPTQPSHPSPTIPATKADAWSVRATGTVHAMVVATQGVQSFGQPTANAPTTALNPVLANPSTHRLTFQTQQTRLGLQIGEGTPLHGQVEIDFIHFDQSSPTTQAFPRMRIANLEWAPNNNHKFYLGQNWDIFGNTKQGSLLSHSFNLVGTMFGAGNIGFMRQQLGWTGTFKRIETSVALGLQSANPTPTFTNVENKSIPTVAGRLGYALNDKSVAGVSALATQVTFGVGSQADARLAAGVVAYVDYTCARQVLNVHAEAYVAQNLANLGALNLGYGRAGQSVADAGGYASAKLTHRSYAYTLMAGMAHVLHSSDVVPGYTPAVIDVNTNAVTSAASVNAPSGPGITSNLSVHAGAWYVPRKGFAIVVEPYLYSTRFALHAQDRATTDARTTAFGVILGSMLQF